MVRSSHCTGPACGYPPAWTTASTPPRWLGVGDAVGIAERGARRIRLTRFSAQERANVKAAQSLLRIAVAGSASPAKPETAYRGLIAKWRLIDPS